MHRSGARGLHGTRAGTHIPYGVDGLDDLVVAGDGQINFGLDDLFMFASPDSTRQIAELEP